MPNQTLSRTSGANRELSEQLIARINQHLAQRGHPVKRLLEVFQDTFAKVYADFVDNEATDNKRLIEKIESMGRQFTLDVFKSVNDFVNAIFETLLTFYDPDIEGYLEDCERDLDKIVLTRTVYGQAYYVLIVLSRVLSKDRDKELRFKA